MPDERDTLEQDGNVANTVEIEQPIQHRPKTAKEREAERARIMAELEEEKRKKKEEAQRQKELEIRRYKRKLITPGIMLTVGLIVAITMFLMKFENSRMLKWLLIILIVSCILGRLIQYMFEKFAKQNEESVSDEGEVINKGLAPSDEVKDTNG